MLTLVGFFTHDCIASLVTSWNRTRFVVSIGRSNCIHMCQAIASPSLSSSVAKNILEEENLDMIFFICATWSFFSSIIVNVGSNVFFVSMDFNPPIALKCPIDAMQLYSSPRKCSIFAHFDGDSTINRYFACVFIATVDADEDFFVYFL